MTEAKKQFATPAPGWFSSLDLIRKDEMILCVDLGAYDVDDSMTRSLGSMHQSSFKSTSKREAFDVKIAGKVLTFHNCQNGIHKIVCSFVFF